MTSNMQPDTVYKLVVIDCRYHYEYQGGHIRTAINISSPQAMSYLFKDARDSLFDETFLDKLLALEGKDVSTEDLKKLLQNNENLSDLYSST